MDDYPTEVPDKYAILDLEIARDEHGRILFHSLEWAKSEHLVIVYDDNGKGWIRGKGMKRYRVIPTYSINSAIFPRLDSGR